MSKRYHNRSLSKGGGNKCKISICQKRRSDDGNTSRTVVHKPRFFVSKHDSVLGFVKSESIAGKLSLNPFNFKDYKLTNISVSVNGTTAANLKVSYDVEEGQTIVAVLTNIMESGGHWLKDSGCNITRSDIQKGGYCLYSFDLEPVFREADYLTLSRQGNLRLEVQFAEALPETVTAVIYSETLAYFEVNKARDIITE